MTAPSRFDLVIFDCDGVLIDSEIIACRIDAECLAEIGFPITVEDILDRYLGISLAGMLADLEERHGRKLPADFPARLRQRAAAAFEAELRVIPGIEASLDALSHPICVASSSIPERLRHSLTLVGLHGRFAPHIFSSAQVARGKPAPDLFLFAAERMGAAPQRCLVVEDSLAGVQAARAAGMTVLGFTGGGHCRDGHAARLSAAGAAAVFANMGELPGLVASI